MYCQQISEATKLDEIVSGQIPRELSVKFALGSTEHIVNEVMDSLLSSLLLSTQESTECFKNWFFECR